MYKLFNGEEEVSGWLNPLPLQLMVVLIAYFASNVSYADEKIYKVVDETGAVIYTDSPPIETDASVTALPAINRLPATDTGETDSIEVNGIPFAGYSTVEIAEPLDDSVIYYDQQQVNVRLALVPELQKGHLVQFTLDGYPHGGPDTKTHRIFTGLQRGSHSLAAQVLNAQGTLVGQSSPVNIHVQRHFRRN